MSINFISFYPCLNYKLLDKNTSVILIFIIFICGDSPGGVLDLGAMWYQGLNSGPHTDKSFVLPLETPIKPKSKIVFTLTCEPLILFCPFKIQT